jgi:glycosyltransferase involved in cell wall biosynthesis
MSTYNDAQFLPQALNSALGQGFSDWELLVVNDASSDDTEKILQDYRSRDARINFWTNPSQKGLIANLNFALVKAQGELVARLDSDDSWLDTNKLQKQLDFLNRNPEYCMVGAWAEVIGQDGKKLYNFMPPGQDQDIRKEILSHNCFVHSAILARKKNIIEAGGYDPEQKYVEDYALWLKMGTAAKFANLPEILVQYRINSAGITQTKNIQQISAALALVEAFKTRYPGQFKAKIKWRLQRLLSAILGPKNLVKFK